jgi:hypothetical protein
MRERARRDWTPLPASGRVSLSLTHTHTHRVVNQQEAKADDAEDDEESLDEEGGVTVTVTE